MKRRGQGRGGWATIEFALIFLMLWAFLSGCFRLGYSIYLYETLECAVAGAARYASRVDFDSPNYTFVTGVKNIAVYGDPSGGTVALAPNLTTSNITVLWTLDTKGIPSTITVEVTGYTVNALFQTFTWSSKPSVTVRYAGSYKS
jgi:Flp pilus assembly protein TadG